MNLDQIEAAAFIACDTQTRDLVALIRKQEETINEAQRIRAIQASTIDELTESGERLRNTQGEGWLDQNEQPDSGRDAARYRWLRSDDISVPSGQREINVYLERLPFREDQRDELLTGQEMDAAIDAAMAAQQGEQAPAAK